MPTDPAKGPVSIKLRAGRWARQLIVVVAGLAVVGFFLARQGDRVSWELLQDRQAGVESFVRDEPFLAVAVFFLAYVIVTGLSLPISVWLSFTAGALFGLLPGIVVASFASTVGASISFVMSRYLFRGSVERRWGNRLAVIQRGVEAEGAYYLLALRLSPLVPYWLVNLGMGLTRMKVCARSGG